MTLTNMSAELLGLLWRATWQSALLATIVATIIHVTRQRIDARWRVYLWTVPLCRMLLLIVPVSGLSLYSGVVGTGESLVQQASVNLQGTVAYLQQVEAKGTVEGRIPLIDSSKLHELVTSKTTPNEQAAWRTTMLYALTGVWFVGFVLMLGRWAFSLVALRRLLASCQPLGETHLAQLSGSELNHENGSARLRFLVTNTDLGPATCGVLRPTIVLPRQLVDELAIEQLGTVIRHELQHIRRKDGVLLFVSRLAAAIHWFNPLVYWIGVRLRRNMELAVDAATVGNLDDRQRQSYGQLLIQLALRPANQFGLAQMANRNSNLRSRIEAIAGPHRGSRVRSTLTLAAILVLTITGLCDTAQTQESKRNATQAATTTANAKDELAKPAPEDEKPKKSAREQATEDREKRLAVVEPEFRKIYNLNEHEVLRHIPEPLDRELRQKWCDAIFGGLEQDDRMQIVTLFVQWKDKRPQWKGATVGFSDGGVPIRSVLMMLDAVSSQDIEGETTLLDKKIPGDWVFDPTASADEIVAAMEPALSKEWGFPVTLTFREVERDVCVVRGKWDFKPISDELHEVQIYGDYINEESGNGGGSGEFNKFLANVGSWIELPIANEVAEPPSKEISWRYHMPSPTTPHQLYVAHNPELVTTNLTTQTGLTFAIERRRTRMLFVEK